MGRGRTHTGRSGTDVGGAGCGTAGSARDGPGGAPRGRPQGAAPAGGGGGVWGRRGVGVRVRWGWVCAPGAGGADSGCAAGATPRSPLATFPRQGCRCGCRPGRLIEMLAVAEIIVVFACTGWWGGAHGLLGPELGAPPAFKHARHADVAACFPRRWRPGASSPCVWCRPCCWRALMSPAQARYCPTRAELTGHLIRCHCRRGRSPWLGRTGCVGHCHSLYVPDEHTPLLASAALEQSLFGLLCDHVGLTVHRSCLQCIGLVCCAPDAVNLRGNKRGLMQKAWAAGPM